MILVCQSFPSCINKQLSCHRGTARRSKSVKTWSAAAKPHDESHFYRPQRVNDFEMYGRPYRFYQLSVVPCCLARHSC